MTCPQWKGDGEPVSRKVFVYLIQNTEHFILKVKEMNLDFYSCACIVKEIWTI